MLKYLSISLSLFLAIPAYAAEVPQSLKDSLQSCIDQRGIDHADCQEYLRILQSLVTKVDYHGGEKDRELLIGIIKHDGLPEKQRLELQNALFKMNDVGFKGVPAAFSGPTTAI